MTSASTGRSQGNQTGTGFNERLGAGNSMLLQVPGIQTEALPKLIQGRIWNSVFTMVGQIGTSKGRPIEPTLSAGMGGSCRQGRGPGAPAEATAAAPITSALTRITTTKLDTLIVNLGTVLEFPRPGHENTDYRGEPITAEAGLSSTLSKPAHPLEMRRYAGRCARWSILPPLSGKDARDYTS